MSERELRQRAAEVVTLLATMLDEQGNPQPGSLLAAWLEHGDAVLVSLARKAWDLAAEEAAQVAAYVVEALHFGGSVADDIEGL